MNSVSRQILMAAGGAKKEPPVLTYVTATMTGGNFSSRTFPSFSIGSASPTRRVIVALSVYGSATNIASVTVAGQSTTKLVQAQNGGTVTAIFVTDNPVTSGTTADIAITLNANSDRWAIATYSATGLTSVTPVGTATTNTNGGSVSVSGSKDGFIVGVGGGSGYYGEGGSASWTGLTQSVYLNGYTTYAVGMYASMGSKALTSDGSTSASLTLGDIYQPAFAYASLR